MKELKRNCRTGLAIALIAVIALPGSLLMAQEEKMNLDSAKGAANQGRPAVMFPHNRHIESGLECKACHHLYRNGKNVLDEGQLVVGNPDIRCAGCHRAKADFGLQKAFHDQCIGCHVTYRNEKRKTGPRYCGACHVRK